LRGEDKDAEFHRPEKDDDEKAIKNLNGAQPIPQIHIFSFVYSLNRDLFLQLAKIDVWLTVYADIQNSREKKEVGSESTPSSLIFL